MQQSEYSLSDDEEDDDEPSGPIDKIMYLAFMAAAGAGGLFLIALQAVSRLGNPEPRVLAKPHMRSRRRHRPIAFFDA